MWEIFLILQILKTSGLELIKNTKPGPHLKLTELDSLGIEPEHIYFY